MAPLVCWRSPGFAESLPSLRGLRVSLSRGVDVCGPRPGNRLSRGDIRRPGRCRSSSCQSSKLDGSTGPLDRGSWHSPLIRQNPRNPRNPRRAPSKFSTLTSGFAINTRYNTRLIHGRSEFASLKVIEAQWDSTEQTRQPAGAGSPKRSASGTPRYCGCLDFVYIDGDHTLRAISIDLIKVYPKVRAGGWIGGDDFTHTVWQHGARFEPTLVFPFAVYFGEAVGARIFGLPHLQFLICKPTETETSFEFVDLSESYPDTTLQGQFRLQRVFRGWVTDTFSRKILAERLPKNVKDTIKKTQSR